MIYVVCCQLSQGQEHLGDRLSSNEPSALLNKKQKQLFKFMRSVQWKISWLISAYIHAIIFAMDFHCKSTKQLYLSTMSLLSVHGNGLITNIEFYVAYQCTTLLFI